MLFLHALSSLRDQFRSLFLLTLLSLAAIAGVVVVTVQSASTVTSSVVQSQSQNQGNIRKLKLLASDLVTDPTSSKIYATVPSSVGVGGNSITPIDTAAGTLGQPISIGSEPGKMAISDDGGFIYVILTGAAAVRRFDVATQTAGPQFTVGNIPNGKPFFARDITVAPGNPHTWAVDRFGGFPDGNVAVFDDGVMRSGTVSFSELTGVQFGSTTSRLYTFQPFPTPGRVSRLSVTNTGVSVDSSNQIPTTITTDSIRFVAGRLYTATGKVIDPEAGVILGSFATGVSSPTAFAIDSVNSRAFYATSQGSTLTITAFDTNSFQSTDSLNLTGVNGTPTSVVRWGGNGLAVSTTGGEVFLIQSSLVPSVDPIPSPTPTPSSTPTPSPSPTPETFIRQLSLANNDIVYVPSNQTIYASVPSSVGANGNSLTAIDPHTGAIGQSVFIGSEPDRLAVNQSGQTVFVGFRNETTVGRFEVATQSAGSKFRLFSNQTFGGAFVNDLAVAPGTSETLAISSAGISVFDGGVRRQDSVGGELDNVLWGDTSSKLYSSTRNSNGANLRSFNVGPSGITVAHTYSNLLLNSFIAYSNGKIYSGSTNSNRARVFDPETGAMLGTLFVQTPHLTGQCTNSWIVPDPALNRVFTLCSEFTTPFANTVTIAAFDMQTMVPLGDFNVTGVLGNIGRMVRWGTNGLAFRTSANQLFIIETALVSAAQPIPTPTPTPPGSPTPTPDPTPAPGELRKLNLSTRQLVADSAGQAIFASVPTGASVNPNTVTPIDPVAGTLGAAVPIGNDPGVMTMSQDDQFIYVGLDGDRAVRRFDVATRTAGPQFGVGIDPQFGALAAQDIAVMPGQPTSIAVARRRVGVSPGHGGVAIFDNGVQRPVTTPSFFGSNSIEFSTSSTVLYGQDTENQFLYRKMGIANCGVSIATVSPFATSISDFKIVNGLIFSMTGRVVDPEDGTELGAYLASAGGAGRILADVAAGKVYAVGGRASTSVSLDVFDMRTFRPLLRMIIPLPGEFNFPTPQSLVRWGQHGIAFNTGQGVYLLENALIGGVGQSLPPGPTPIDPTYTVNGQFQFFGVINEAAGVKVDITGAVNSSIIIPADRADFTVTGIPACGSVTITPSKPDFIFSPASITFNNPSEIQPAIFTVIPNAVRLSRSTLSVSEALTATSFTVQRTGDTSTPASVEYETIPGTASDRSDFTAVRGRIDFVPGQTSRTIPVLLSNDTLVEGPETFSVVIKNAGGVMMRAPDTLVITITDNDFSPPTSNPLDDAAFYVRQHYHDFLNREPDASGLAFWIREITSCGSDAGCIEVKRINVSAAFFLSIEFQETGYLVYRMYKSGFGNLNGKPVPVRLSEFLQDTQFIGQGVQVGVGNWEAQLEANKQAYALAFVQRPEFQSAFPNSLTADQFVTQLDSNAGGVLSPGEKADLIAVLDPTPSDLTKRASVLRSVAEDADLRRVETNKAFVLMQYFGYLRRNPDDAPDSNFDGYNFWLGKLNSFNGNFIQAEMVKAFITSDEYRRRFGP